MLVLGGGVFTAGGPIGRSFPILEMVPLVGRETCAGKFPSAIETIKEVETDGEF